MRIIAVIMAVFLWLLGALFFLAAAAPEAVASGKVLPRVVVGFLLFAGGLVLVVFAWRSGKSTTAGGSDGEKSQQEAPGQLSLKALTCPHCGGQADASSVKVGAQGTMSVTCQYCGAVYLIQEEPKW